MGQAERRSRMQAMGAYVNSHDVFAWAASVLGEADTPAGVIAPRHP